MELWTEDEQSHAMVHVGKMGGSRRRYRMKVSKMLGRGIEDRGGVRLFLRMVSVLPVEMMWKFEPEGELAMCGRGQWSQRRLCVLW